MHSPANKKYRTLSRCLSFPTHSIFHITFHFTLEFYYLGSVLLTAIALAVTSLSESANYATRRSPDVLLLQQSLEDIYQASRLLGNTFQNSPEWRALSSENLRKLGVSNHRSIPRIFGIPVHRVEHDRIRNEL
jgi:hypothetical protein